MRAIRRQCLATIAGCLLAAQAAAMAAPRPDATLVLPAEAVPPAQVAQGNCTSLSEAVERVRRRSDVERVISAETRVSQGREVHYIRVMTRDGKVRTERVSGCPRN